MDQRINIHTYFLIIAKAASLRATCPRRAVGTVLVKDGQIVSTGYNGSLTGTIHCSDPGYGCLMHEGRCIRTVHSEANAVCQANEPADTAYCTDYPCINCLKLLLQVGVKRIYYIRDDYPDKARDLFVETHGLESVFIHRPLSNVILEVTD